MIKQNPWSRWQSLTPEPALMVGEVVSIDAVAGTSVVQIPPVAGGSLLRVSGTSVAVGDRAFVRGGVIEGAAPELELVEVEV